MGAYLVKRLLLTIPVLVVTALLVFAALHLSPGDPVDVIVGPIAPQSVRERVRLQLGLDKPLPVQFLIYMGRVARGNLGESILNRKPVLDIIAEKLPVTAELGLSAFALTYLLAVPLGVVAALRRNSVYDWSSMVVALIGVSVPGFWLGLVLIYVFSVGLRVLPPSGYGGLSYLILPTLALALPRVGRVARITRSSMLEVIGQDYVRTAHAKGLPSHLVVIRHALRNALIPIMSVMGLDLGYIVGGAVVIEAIFARAGIGQTMLRAIYSRDFPVLQGCMFVLAFAIILGNIISDMCYVVVDPRIRQ